MIPKHVEQLIDLAISEDLGQGDHTTLACVDSKQVGQAELLVKESGIIAGVELAKFIFKKYDQNLGVHASVSDGESVKKGQIAFTVAGSVRSLLTSERLVLNVMQRMSGVSTVTRQYADRISHTKAKVLDTRKTTPGMRWMEKEAVRMGGGQNHRHGLYDMLLIKDNHVDAAGSVDAALGRAHDYLTYHNLDLPIELEVRNLEELIEGMSHEGIDRLMLDNFTPAQTHEAVGIVDGRFALESSGGITINTIADYAEAGVDFISIGALTHSVRSLDLSLKLVKE